MRRISALVLGALLAANAPCASSTANEPGKNGNGAPRWEDPYPSAPAKNDRRFIGRKWRPGPTIEDHPLEYLAQVPAGATANLPLIVVGAAGEDGLGARKDLYDKAVVLYIGPMSSVDGEAIHNKWLADKIDAGSGPECSPTCSAWSFVPATAIRDMLEDFAKHVRFDHRRVQMFATNDARYGVYRALDPILQPYFAGVAHGVYAEWQQASCADAPAPTSRPPAIFFSWGGCDDSFCPTIACMNTLRNKGYAIDASSGGDASPATCPCPATDRAHMRQAGANVRKSTYDWLLTNARK